MKKILPTIILLSMAMPAMAARLSDCLNDIRNLCGENVRIYSGRTECRVIDSGYDSRGNHFNKRIAIFDENTILSYEIQNDYNYGQQRPSRVGTYQYGDRLNGGSGYGSGNGYSGSGYGYNDGYGRQSAYCPSSRVDLYGFVTDYAEVDGRLFFVHSANKVLVIARNNNIMEMLNSEGNSYSTVTGVQPGYYNGLVLVRGRQVTELDQYAIDNRLNNPRTSRTISYSK